MPRKKKSHLVHAATLLPLAIGLAGNARISRTAAVSGTAGGALKLACTLPFQSIQKRHPIDGSCPANGAAPLKTPQAAQNQAKNNFCASGTPVNIDFKTLKELQDVATARGISFGGDSQLPADRSQLRNLPTSAGALGEGTLVRLAAFVIDAHYSNVGVGKGESVNCKQPDKEGNDIHIVLGEKSNHDDECSSVTAEMSPHFRPEAWDPNDLNVRNAHLYRFTGHLFFDASHRPCSGGKGSPKRSSIWEVHPVYAVDICADAGNNCKVDSDENWVSFAEQVGAISSETRLWLPDEISTRFSR
jgi:hypothetical protein